MPAPDYAVEIAQLEQAAATGELTIEQNGERVTYRSLSDIRQALTYFQAKACAASGSAGPRSAFGFSAPAFSRD